MVMTKVHQAQRAMSPNESVNSHFNRRNHIHKMVKNTSANTARSQLAEKAKILLLVIPPERETREPGMC